MVVFQLDTHNFFAFLREEIKREPQFEWIQVVSLQSLGPMPLHYADNGSYYKPGDNSHSGIKYLG